MTENPTPPAPAPPPTPRPRRARSRLLILFVALALGVPAGFVFAHAVRVPTVKSLADYQPSIITRIFDRNGTPFAEYAIQKRIINGSFDVRSFDGRANLAAIHERAQHRSIGRAIQVRTLKHDHRVLATQLEIEGKQTFGRGTRDLATGLHTSCEYQLVDIGFDECRARRTVTGGNQKDVARNAGFIRELTHVLRAQR